jgi:hypothetical protein
LEENLPAIVCFDVIALAVAEAIHEAAQTASPAGG